MLDQEPSLHLNEHDVAQVPPPSVSGGIFTSGLTAAYTGAITATSTTRNNLTLLATEDSLQAQDFS